MGIVRSTLWATRSVLADKWKMLLLTLVVSICVAALALTVSFVSSCFRIQESSMALSGYRSCFIHTLVSPFAKPTSSEHALDLQDLKTLRECFAGRASFFPLSGTSRMLSAGGYHVQSFVLGKEPLEWQRDNALSRLKDGRLINQEDIAGLARVCVLNVPVCSALFGKASPLGKEIRVGDMPFKVVGVIENREIMGWRSGNCIIWIPLATCLHRLLNVTALNGLFFDVNHGQDTEKIAEEVGKVLRKRHGIIPPQKDDFSISTPGQAEKAFDEGMQTVRRMSALIMGLAFLLAAGVLAQVQWVSVNHRIGEIGVRRALGASRRDVLLGFLLESLLLSVLGAIVGMLLAAASIPLIHRACFEAPDNYSSGSLYSPFSHLQLDGWTLIACVVATILIGLAAGVLPALKAARLNPVEALR